MFTHQRLLPVLKCLQDLISLLLKNFLEGDKNNASRSLRDRSSFFTPSLSVHGDDTAGDNTHLDHSGHRGSIEVFLNDISGIVK